jgi:IS5 family transposase
MKSITETLGGAQALLDISYEIQGCFEEHLNDEQKTFLQLIRIIESFLPPNALIQTRNRTGRPPYLWISFLRSMFAKSFFSIEKTSSLIQRLKSDPNLRLLCAFNKVPSKGKFSTAFSYLAELNLTEAVLTGMARAAHKGRTVLHICRDSSAIAAREKAPRKTPKKAEKKVAIREKRDKNAPKPPKEPTVIEKQTAQDPHESINALNKHCAWGCKKNSQGNVSFWKGYKLHLDVTDTGFPVTFVVTGANVHDSQLAVPMEKLTAEKVQYCYSLMDSAFDSKQIEQFIYDSGHVPIIDPNCRKDKNRAPLDPPKQERYKNRATVERSYSMLKDWLVPRAIYVKGHTKISFVLSCSVLCLAAMKFLMFNIP